MKNTRSAQRLNLIFICGVFALPYFACASPPIRTDIGEISQDTAELAALTVERLKNENAPYELTIHEKLDPANMYSSVYVKQKFYSEKQPLSGNDSKLLGLLIKPDEEITDKMVASPSNAPRSRGKPWAPGVYVYYSNRTRSASKTKTTEPVSLLIAPAKTTDPNLLKGMYHDITRWSSKKVAEKFATPGGFEGYVITTNPGKPEALVFILAASADYFVALRIQSEFSINMPENQYIALAEASRHFSEQMAIFIAGNKVLGKCEGLSYETQKKMRQDCFKAEAAKAEQSRRNLEHSGASTGSKHIPSGPREKTENEKWRSCHAAGRSGCGYQ